MSMDLAKKTFSTQPDYLIAGTAEIVTATKEVGSAALKRGAPVVLGEDGKLAAVKVSGSGTYTVDTTACTAFWRRTRTPARRALCTCPASSSRTRWCCRARHRGGRGNPAAEPGHFLEVRRTRAWLTK